MRSRLASRLVLLTIAVSLIFTGAIIVRSEPQQAPIALPSTHPRVRRAHDRVAFQLPRLQVEVGSNEAAEQYYKDTLSPQTSFLTKDTILKSPLTALLKYFGYDSVSPSDLHQLPSEALIAKSPSPGDILATRYFAPKITDVSEKNTTIPELGFGWRKLVRFKARPQSPADTNGIDSLLFLQNIFEPTATGDPFDATKNVGLFNQAIMVRRAGTFDATHRSLYFLTYGELVEVKIVDNRKVPVVNAQGGFSDRGVLITSLKATFMEKDRDPETNLGADDYFVPAACEQCHGDDPIAPKVNFLDTDHFIDRVFPNYNLADAKFTIDDFTALASSDFGVLYDAGKDDSAAKYAAAFAVIRQLNGEIATQNAAVQGTFQLGAVNKWLELHGSNKFAHKHAPPSVRGFGTPSWDSAKESDRELLYYLNRYCYRCHSSVAYNIFERPEILSRKNRIPVRVKEIARPERWMPQDRIFPGLTVQNGVVTPTGDLKRFLDLLQAMQ